MSPFDDNSTAEFEGSQHPVSDEEILGFNFQQAFNLPPDASNFLLRVWRSIQFFDDAADGDAIERADLDIVLWDHFIGFVSDPFFISHAEYLKSQLATMIVKWQASDIAERQGCVNAHSFMWRAGFYDLVLSVAILCHGYGYATQISKNIMDSYGEKLEDYIREFE